jgi:hypothetical protein
MKLSEKALRLIGLTVLKSMDNKNFQDNSKHPRNSAPPGGYGRPRLTMEARLNAAKAPVIPFHRKKPAS